MRNLLLIGCLLLSRWAFGQLPQETMVLNRGWFFSQADSVEWLSAEVPGTVHQDLIRHGLLPDPFYGMNERKIQWVEEKDWEYKTVFTVTGNQLKRDGAQLLFEGLDTYADVYLNGALILKADNMFVGYRVPVKHLLREGENCLHVFFHSPIKQTLPQWRSNGFDYPADNDHRKERLSVFTRKAPYSYGWDWGIRMVTSGVWRPVSLCFSDVADIEDFYVRQLSVSADRAEVRNEVTLQGVASENRKVKVAVVCFLRGKEVKRAECEHLLVPGSNLCRLPLDIVSPERWMPNGWGDPVLYDFVTEVSCDDRVVATKKQRIGLRSVRVVNEKDKEGECFYFEVNGVPMFAKGANYIPSDAMLPAVTTERYEALFRDIRTANMNMIRVWGGGVYEDDRFYSLADENGILVWQDFMFGCTTYPHDPVFLKRVEAEADYNIRRLRNHACLAMWCGNNEILEGIKYWGWSRKYEPQVYEGMKSGYKQLFEQLLPERVEALDEGRFYIHGSPYLANWGRPDSWAYGDSHNWGVWYGRKPFESLDREIPRFMSEFGFQSFPEMKTIAAFAAPEDYAIESAVMNAHQKSSIGNDLILTYMERDYKKVRSFEDFVYVGLVMQGRGIRRGLEAHRRNRPYCMGTLYWQLNDSWPVVSWSGIDYYGNWKALHYQAMRAFNPLTLNVIGKGDSIQVWVLSDLLKEMPNVTVEFRLTDFEGRVQKKKVVKTLAPANRSVCVYEEDVYAWVTAEQRRNSFLLVTLRSPKGAIVMTEPYYFNAPKELDLPVTNIDYRMKMTDGGCEIVLLSKRLAKDVFIECPVQGVKFSDNFFDLLPGESKRIRMTSPLFKKDQKVDIRIRHLRESYE